MDVINQQARNELLDRVSSKAVIAVGCGSGMHYVIRALAKLRGDIAGVITTSTWSEHRIRQLGLTPIDSNETDTIDIFVDSAAEVTMGFDLNKGKDSELSRAKYFAHCAKEFICFGSEEACVEQLGDIPVAIEVLPFARSHVVNYFENANIEVQWNTEFSTENGNPLLLVQNGNIQEPAKLEQTLESIPGVLSCSINSIVKPGTMIISTGRQANVLSRPLRKKNKPIVPNNVVNIRSFLNSLAD